MKEITLEATIQNIAAATEFIDTELEQTGCSTKVRFQIDMAIDELYTNVASYAYPSGKGDLTVRFEADKASRTIRVTFEDRGIPYNPLEKEDPDVTLPAEKRQIGGLGIFMVKKMMDGMYYEYNDGKNILTIEKKIG